MGATPNFDAVGNDDVSINRGNVSGTSTPSGTQGLSGRSTIPSDGRADTGTPDDIGNKSEIDSGIDKVQHKAQNAMSQLQTKASEMTSRLVDSIDVEDLTQKLEHQVREHPARTLLLAAGAGFMLGRSLQRTKH